MKMSEEFRFGFNGDINCHTKNNKDCDECWCGYPIECKCGGLIHAQFGDEMEDGYYLEMSCDQCGEMYEELED